MTFSDIFKQSFLEGYATSEMTAATMLTCFGITAVIGVYIFLVYRLLTRKTFYDKSFNISLPVLAIITAAVILTIQSNVVLSLGMVGALSIVRFRTAIKNALDLVFLFWAISVGIICGAGLAQIAVGLSLVLTAGMLLLDLIPVAKAPMLLVVNADVDPEVEKEVLAYVKSFSRHHTVKSRNLSGEQLDMVVQVRTREEGKLVRKVLGVEGVYGASIISHDGEVTF